VSLFLGRNRRLLAFVGFVLGIARLVLAVVATSHQTADSCASAGISTAAGREGICVRDFGLDGGKTTYNVVDSGHTLKMPGYDARILASNLSTILVSGNDQADYPDNQGLLVSYDLAVTNTGGTSLPFDSSGQDASLSIATTPGQNLSDSWPQEVAASPLPSPQLLAKGPIAPGATNTGWVSFTVPVWTRPLLNQRPSDLVLLRPGQEQGYEGQIRLWK
jgi:hypothetical protein